MHRDLEVVTEVESVVIAAERMRARRIGSVPAISSKHCRRCGDIVGIITETDLVRKVIAQGLNASQTTVTQVMASPLLTITPDRSMLDASQLMEINHVRHLCVSEGGALSG
jgi:CBS domain-containing protein